MQNFNFRAWRRTRPFWAGVLTIAGGIFIGQLLAIPLGFLVAAGQMSALTWGTAAILVLCGLFFWFAPAQRHFVALVAAIVAVLSFPVTNFGGFGIGMILSLTGAAMAFGWKPFSDDELAARQAEKELEVS